MTRLQVKRVLHFPAKNGSGLRLIARALLKDALILLLDEPTASLDARNEVTVQKAIGQLEWSLGVERNKE